jgi:Prolyl oligopeptidase, N-terminal beta-propeller domain
MDKSLPEEVLLDENEAAVGHAFYMTANVEVSPDHRLLAYGEDTTGNEMYTLHVRDLATGKELLPKPIPVRAAAHCCGRMMDLLSRLDRVPLLAAKQCVIEATAKDSMFLGVWLSVGPCAFHNLSPLRTHGGDINVCVSNKEGARATCLGAGSFGNGEMESICSCELWLPR